MPTVDEMDALVDSLPEPAQVELKLGFSTADLQDLPLLQVEDYLKRLPPLEKKARENPQDLLLQKRYYETASGAYAQDSARLNALIASQKRVLENYLAQNPQSGEAHYQLSMLHTATGQIQEAFAHAEQASQWMPDSAKVWVHRASLHQNTGDIPKAKELFLEALRRDAQNLDAQILYLFSGFYEQMSQMSLDQLPGIQIDGQYLEAAYAQKPSRPLETLRYAAQLLEVFYRALAQLYLHMEEDDSSAKNSLQKLLSNDARLPAIKDFFEKELKNRKHNPGFVWQALGFVALLQGQNPLAFEYFEKSRLANPARADIYGNMIFLHVLKEEWQNAEKLIRQKIQMAPAPADYAMLARVYLQAGQPEKQGPALEEGLQKYPQDATLHYYRALVAYKNRDRDLAEMHLSESVQISAQNLDAILVYGLWLVYRQRLQEGLQALYFAKSQGNETAAQVFDLYFEIKQE
ncbi:MAG: hypothetical protein OHK0053_14180 [Microscillaceae bacterium]